MFSITEFMCIAGLIVILSMWGYHMIKDYFDEY